MHLPQENKWYELYGKDTIQSYLRLAVQFVEATNFWQFYQEHLDEYRIWAREIEAEIEQQGLVVKLDAFFESAAVSERPNFYIAMDPLNGWGAHAVPHVHEINPKFKGYKAYSIGFWDRESTPDAQPSFTKGDYLYNLIWHEGSHIYLDPFLKTNQEAIQNLGYLYNKDDEGMIRQNISTWKYCFEENLIRGIVISLIGKYQSERAWKRQKAREFLRDFIYAEAISEWLDEHFMNKREKDFGKALPQLIRFLARTFPERPYQEE